MASITENNGVILAPRQQSINLKWPERYVSIIAGTKVAFSGLKNFLKNPITSIIKIGAGGYLVNRGITGHCELYDMAGKTTTEAAVVQINTSVIVAKPRSEVYDFWRRLDNLPLFMTHLKSVEQLEGGRSKWTMKLPADIAAVTWEAQITHDVPDDLIAWASVEGSMITTSGRVLFAETPEPETTLVHVSIEYRPPAGGFGAGIAQLINPLFKKMVEDDVQNFKRYMDISAVTDEMATETSE